MAKSDRSKLAILFVLSALLLFTTVRTSPIFAGFENPTHTPSLSSVSKIIVKQRQLLVTDFNWIAPVLNQSGVVQFSYSAFIPLLLDEGPDDWCPGRCSDLPPPIVA